MLVFTWQNVVPPDFEETKLMHKTLLYLFYFALKEEKRLKVLENKVFRKIFEAKSDD